MGKKVFLVANDFGESVCIEKIGAELKNQGYEIIEVLGKGKNLVLTDEMVGRALSADLVVTAISEFNEMEVRLAVAVRNAMPNMPIVVYAPGRYAFRNKGATLLRSIADLLLVGNKDEVVEARMLYSKAKVAAIGNMLHEDFYPTLSVAEARQKAMVRDDQKLIFVPGDKRFGINWPLFHSVVEACHRESVQKHNPVVAIGIHPGDNTYKPDTYQDLVKFSRKVPVKIFTRDVLPSSILVTACDLLVTAVSTLATAAAFQRKPVIGFYFENLVADLEMAQDGRPFNWEPERDGSAEVVREGSIDRLATSIEELLTPKGFKTMRGLQEYHYPSPPAPGSTAKKAVELIKLSG
ncbi:MAG: hypothetical protein Q7K16_04795 [Candidatus Azambacteria bacterium]|nr:hypothetical protein [Candidatus Azambacteria bacterium]